MAILDQNLNSALHVNEGIDQPPSINIPAANKFKKTKQHNLPIEDFLSGIRDSNRTILSKAITLVESSLRIHQDFAQQIINRCLPYSGNSIRIGITGVPGVGKSSFIEAFGKYLSSSGHRIAVLAIDPSSTKSRGSILGDKTRMEELAVDSNAYIRPSPSAGSLGGVARKTRETIILCEAAGFDVIIVETVGVGQSETAVHSMVDFFLLLMLAGAGDELQGIKRGIMEMADAVVINKADGDNLPRVSTSLSQLKNALHFFHPSESGWSPVAETCSSITKMGIPRVWQIISEYISFVKSNNYFKSRRLEQSKQIMHLTIDQALHDHFYHHPSIKKQLKKVQEELFSGEVSAYIAAKRLLDIYFTAKEIK
jgi:LAO/AO transport system kinase